VLLALWKDHSLLEDIRDKVEKNGRYVTPKLKFQVYLIQVKCQVAKTVLYGLKDAELEQLIKDVEEIKEKLGITETTGKIEAAT